MWKLKAQCLISRPSNSRTNLIFKNPSLRESELSFLFVSFHYYCKMVSIGPIGGKPELRLTLDIETANTLDSHHCEDTLVKIPVPYQTESVPK